LWKFGLNKHGAHKTWPKNAEDASRCLGKPTSERDATVVMRSIGVAIVTVIAPASLAAGQ